MEEEKDKSAHVLVIPSPFPSHINPMLHFADRLASKGLRATLVVAIQNRGDIPKANPPADASASLEYISDGYDDALPSNFDVEIYKTTLQRVGSEKLLELIARLTVEGMRPVCLIYDLALSWVLEIAHAHGLLGATFITQPVAVCLTYCYYGRGLQIIATCAFFFPECRHWAYETSPRSSPNVRAIHQSLKWTRDEQGDPADCLNWLDKRPVSSVVYVPFGSLAALPAEQMEEVAEALHSSKRPFLWVVKLPYAYQKGGNSLPEGFVEATSEQGLVVPWCPQLDVLAHRAVGCFVTHCGWNSTLEALSQGVPMVSVPQWGDQQTNSKFVSDVWKTRTRVEIGDKGFVLRGELERCIREVMEGETGAHIRENAQRWRDLTREAVAEGGSSDNNINEFITKISIHEGDGNI
ncbi:hypothetical protein AMTR_s00036p00237560 [Amborella trichopoda]|uniref:Glycosyltransferase n=1 Tax=Amborella trichopoda TaxID=13333 RepID=U5D531_AMBTC|nr:hypothetical protein AMTR_s00036p00237560 [Amborella trichopoda]